ITAGCSVSQIDPQYVRRSVLIRVSAARAAKKPSVCWDGWSRPRPEKTSRLSRSRTAVQLRAIQPRIFKPVSAIERRSGAYYSSRWQQLADEAVPAGDTCRANKHNVLRLKREALGQGERGGRFGIQLEDLGWLGGDVCRATNDVDRFAVSCLLADATDRKSTRLNSSHVKISYAVFC